MGYLEILNGGMTSTYIKFATQAKDENDLASLNGLIFKIYMVFGVVASILGITATFFVDDFFLELTNPEIKKLKVLLYMMIFNVILSSINGLFDANIVLNEKFIFQKVVAILKKALLPIISIPLLILGMNVYMIGAIYVLTNAFALAMNSIYCIKNKQIKLTFDNKNKKLIKSILYFYFFVFLTIIVDQINWSIDSFIIGRLRGAFEVSLYSIAHQINSAFLIFSTGISSVFITRIHKIDKNDNESFLELTKKVGRIQFMILSLILTGFILFGQKFIAIWVGTTYKDAYIITLLLITPLVFITIKSILNEVYRAKNKHIARTLIYLGIALINVVISYFLCNKYGAIGAAVGTTISLVIGNIVIMNIYDHHVIKVNMFKFWKEISKLLPAVLLSFILGIIITKLIPTTSIILYLASICVYVIAYVICLYLIGLNKNEKSLITEILKKAKRVLKK